VTRPFALPWSPDTFYRHGIILSSSHNRYAMRVRRGWKCLEGPSEPHTRLRQKPREEWEISLVRGCPSIYELKLCCSRASESWALQTCTEVSSCLAEGETPLPMMGSGSCPSGNSGTLSNTFMLSFSSRSKKTIGPTLFGCIPGFGGSRTLFVHSHNSKAIGPYSATTREGE